MCSHIPTDHAKPHPLFFVKIWMGFSVFGNVVIDLCYFFAWLMVISVIHSACVL